MSEPARRSNEALSVGHDRKQGCGGCSLRACFTFFLLIGLVAGYFLTFRPFWQIVDARGWEQTPCTIRSSEVEVKRGGDSNSYIIRIAYDYEYDGQPYLGDRYHFALGKTNTNVNWKRRIVAEHPVGHKTVCYVDPDNPGEAVIERGWTREMIWGLFPLPFLAAGIGGLLFARKLTNNQADETDGDGTPSRLVSTGPASAADDGPVVLKPQTSPVTGFFVALLLCLFWNGITGIFVAKVVGSFLKGDPEWLLALFATPFVLVGLVLIGATGYTFLTLFNPRPELTLNRSTAPLGGLLQVRWEFRGSVRRVRQFKLSLNGEEKATYRRGTDTHTDSQTFFEHVFYEAGHPAHIATGEAEFEVPADSMHSFSADNNEIVWSLNLLGDIPWWPDVKLSFPIEVTPHESSADQHT